MNKGKQTLSNPKSVNYGTKSLRYLGPKIWNKLPDKLKQAASLSTFKAEIKTWIPTDCPSKLCKLYVPTRIYLKSSLLYICMCMCMCINVCMMFIYLVGLNSLFIDFRPTARKTFTYSVVSVRPSPILTVLSFIMF